MGLSKGKIFQDSCGPLKECRDSTEGCVSVTSVALPRHSLQAGPLVQVSGWRTVVREENKPRVKLPGGGGGGAGWVCRDSSLSESLP